jgi:hypothetical protein
VGDAPAVVSFLDVLGFVSSGEIRHVAGVFGGARRWAVLRLLILILGILAFVGAASAQIKGCTADVRTGVCNKTCSVSHVEGCTLEQLKPLLLIHHMDCLAKGTAKAVCSAEVDKAMADWKAAQKKKAKK